MLTGWKDITKHTGFSPKSIKVLMKQEGFPLQYILSRPVLSKSALDKWLIERHQNDLQKKHVK